MKKCIPICRKEKKCDPRRKFDTGLCRSGRSAPLKDLCLQGRLWEKTGVPDKNYIILYDDSDYARRALNYSQNTLYPVCNASQSNHPGEGSGAIVSNLERLLQLQKFHSFYSFIRRKLESKTPVSDLHGSRTDPAGAGPQKVFQYQSNLAGIP